MAQDHTEHKESGNYLTGMFKIHSKIQVTISLNYNTF